MSPRASQRCESATRGILAPRCRRPRQTRPASRETRWSADPQRGGDRLQQRRLAERLREDVDRAALHHARANRFITLSGDEHDRNVLPAAPQLVLEGWSAHARPRWRSMIERLTESPIPTPSAFVV